MLQLFFLILFSTFSFSLYLYFVELIHNPLVFVILGWSTSVAAYYASRGFDLFNKQFEAFIINGSGEYWTGSKFTVDNNEEDLDEEPAFVFNDSQIEKTIRRVRNVTACDDLYVRILPKFIAEIEEID